MVTVGVVGGTGYTGVELLRLLVAHPGVELTAVTSRTEAGVAIADVFPSFRGVIDLSFSAPEVTALGECDVVFFATPNGTAMELAGALLDVGTRVIDLAADFRLNSTDLWKQWYGIDHVAPALLDEAVYGLPEINRDAISKARLVANPGCYPTAVILGALPVMQNKMATRVIADAKSGVSGAGRGAAVATLFSEASDNFKAYAVDGHRHWPEISQVLNEIFVGQVSRAASESVELTFVPHLTPMLRGIHATIYMDVSETHDLQAVYTEQYAGEPFVDVMPAGAHPDTRSVRGANFCRVAVHRPHDDHRVVILSVIDNLVKGAAGQAVQNMNIMFGLGESCGLETVALVP
jgi:N-acetyl-gamma-glutamyl-phosphate reductase